MRKRNTDNTAGVVKIKKKRNRQESQKRILYAGLEVFSEVGYDAATTKMVANRAGLNESLLQRYFESKAGLLCAINRLCVEALKNQKPYPPQKTPEDEIYQFLTRKLKHENQNVDFIRVIISRSLVDPELRNEIHKQIDFSIDSYLKERLLSFRHRGMIKSGVNIDSLFLAILAFGFAVGIMERIVFKTSMEDCMKRFKTFSQNITKGVCP